MDEEEKQAAQYVEVEIISLEGYMEGVHTTLHVLRAKELAELKKVKIVGEESGKGNKKAPGANQK